ncbi:ROK family protein [Acidisoma sp. C75]
MLGGRASSGAIGIDIGGTNLRAGLVDAAGQLRARRQEPVRPEREAFAARLVDLVRALDPSGLRPVGIGLPGRVDPHRNRPVSAGFLDIADLPLAEMLQGAAGRAVILENDAAMALRAELAVGAARGLGNVALMTIGTGIGGAVALGGEILHGHAFAGQFGHITVQAGGGPACKCGRQGCVETLSSGTALGRLMAEAGLPPGVKAEALLAAAARGEGAARALLARWAAPLRAAIETLIAAFDPEIILLGGGLGAEAAAALAYAPFASDWFQRPVRAAALGSDAGLIGAGLAALLAEAKAPPASPPASALARC